MAQFTTFFGKQNMPDSHRIKTAIEHAVSSVEPLLMQMSGYPDYYSQSVSVALAYARQIAYSLPGPLLVNREAYARDTFVHTLFPHIDAIPDAIASSLSVQEYLRRSQSSNEFYALMGMRRVNKRIFGMELAGSMLQRDVAQQATYFISHTIVDPSPDESLTRETVATRFFHNLTCKVRARIEQRRQRKDALIAERNDLKHRLRTITDIERAMIEVRLTQLEDQLQSIIQSLKLDRYLVDFEAVLLHPERYLRLKQTTITLDSMGIRRNTDDIEQGKELKLSELIGYDRRDWTVTIVRYTNLQHESFAERLDKAYRDLSL